MSDNNNLQVFFNRGVQGITVKEILADFVKSDELPLSRSRVIEAVALLTTSSDLNYDDLEKAAEVEEGSVRLIMFSRSTKILDAAAKRALIAISNLVSTPTAEKCQITRLQLIKLCRSEVFPRKIPLYRKQTFTFV